MALEIDQINRSLFWQTVETRAALIRVGARLKLFAESCGNRLTSDELHDLAVIFDIVKEST